eukprot:9102142-Prorocentrum_lima.AAC.1
MARMNSCCWSASSSVLVVLASCPASAFLAESAHWQTHSETTISVAMSAGSKAKATAEALHSSQLSV